MKGETQEKQQILQVETEEAIRIQKSMKDHTLAESR